jgi:hypothetical protein
MTMRPATSSAKSSGTGEMTEGFAGVNMLPIVGGNPWHRLSRRRREPREKG